MPAVVAPAADDVREDGDAVTFFYRPVVKIHLSGRNSVGNADDFMTGYEWEGGGLFIDRSTLLGRFTEVCMLVGSTDSAHFGLHDQPAFGALWNRIFTECNPSGFKDGDGFCCSRHVQGTVGSGIKEWE